MKTYYHKKILKSAEVFVKKAEDHVEEQVNDYLLTIRENLLLAKKQIQQDSYMEPDLKRNVLRRITLALKDSEECSYDSDSHNWELFRLVNSIVSNLKSIIHIISSIKQSVCKTLQDVIIAVDGLHNLLSYKSKLDFKNPDELSEENVFPGFFESETDRAVDANDRVEEYYDNLSRRDYDLERKGNIMNNFYHKKILKLAGIFVKKAQEHIEEQVDNYVSEITENLILLERQIKQNQKKYPQEEEQELCNAQLSKIKKSLNIIEDFVKITYSSNNYLNKNLLIFLENISDNMSLVSHYLYQFDFKYKEDLDTREIINKIVSTCKLLKNLLNSPHASLEQIDPDTLSEEDIVPGFFEDEEPDAEEKIEQLNRKIDMMSVENEQEKLQEENRKYRQKNPYDSSEEDYYEKRYSNY